MQVELNIKLKYLYFKAQAFIVLFGGERVRQPKRLTEAGVDEAVPHAAVSAVQPAGSQAGGEAERRAADADQHVADADVEQQHVDGGPQSLETAEQNQDQQVVDEAEHHDGAQKHRHHAMTAARQPRVRRVAPVLLQREQRFAQVGRQVDVAHLGEHDALLLGAGRTGADQVLLLKKSQTTGGEASCSDAPPQSDRCCLHPLPERHRAARTKDQNQ